MRTNWVLAAGLLLNTGFSAAQQKTYTDRSLADLAGPVRSTVTKIATFETGVRLPDGPAVVLPVQREHCEYDPDGSQTLGESQQASGPYGEAMLVQRDGQGHLYSRRTLDLQTGQTTRYELFGPHGVMDDRRYLHGELTDEFVQNWDQSGHRSTFVAKDGAGNLVSQRYSTFAADGRPTEETSWAANGMVEWSNTYDPLTGVLQLRNYDRHGTLRLSGTMVHDRLISFWASEENLYGSSFSLGAGPHRANLLCHANGTCDRMIYDYPEKDARNPRSIELRDPAGALKAGAYYDYVLDAHDNWISRIVRVKTTDQQQPILYETDTRILLYWQQP